MPSEDIFSDNFSSLEVYVTLFDYAFLPQGLALYHSLLEHCRDFRLWVLCIDDKCFQCLNNLNLDYIHLLKLSNLETEQLLSVKKDRTRAEYCWTLTPWSIQWVLDADLEAKRVTYIDADIFFFSDPSSIFSDLDNSGKSFLLTGHNFSPSYEQSSTSGMYCVQFVPVTRGKGEIILKYWRDKCIDWCYARFEDGKFGDQKYHEEIAFLFKEDVLILNSDGRFMAPWNLDIVSYSTAVFYHFHGFRILDSQKFLLCQSYRVSKCVIDNVYTPYIRTLGLICALYHSSGVTFKRQTSVTLKLRFKMLVTKCVRPIFSFLRRCENSAIVGYIDI